MFESKHNALSSGRSRRSGGGDEDEVETGVYSYEDVGQKKGKYGAKVSKFVQKKRDEFELLEKVRLSSFFLSFSRCRLSSSDAGGENALRSCIQDRQGGRSGVEEKQEAVPALWTSL
jgi:hypothetical protein